MHSHGPHISLDISLLSVSSLSLSLSRSLCLCLYQRPSLSLSLSLSLSNSPIEWQGSPTGLGRWLNASRTVSHSRNQVNKSSCKSCRISPWGVLRGFRDSGVFAERARIAALHCWQGTGSPLAFDCLESTEPPAGCKNGEHHFRHLFPSW